MNGVVVFMLGGVSQVWRWSYALWYGGKEVSLKNEKKKKTRKQLRILNDLRIIIPIEPQQCWWRILRTKCVGDEIKISVTVVCLQNHLTLAVSIWHRAPKSKRGQQVQNSATNTRTFSSILSHQHCCIRYSRYSTQLIMKNPNNRWSKQLQIFGWSDSSTGSQFWQWPQLEKVATSLQLIQQGHYDFAVTF